MPSAAERVVIKQRIALSEQRTSGYCVEIINAKRIIVQLEQFMAQEARDREILLGSLSAIRRIPEDVLSLIFQAYVLDHGGSPWILTQVSFLFRKAAFASHCVST